MKIKNIRNFPKMSGIYKFTNIKNGKIYIGETINFKQRMSGHVRNANRRPELICLAFAKYGFDSFEYEIIEKFEIGSISKPELIALEEKYIKKFNSLAPNGYNICAKGTDTTGYKFSDESRKKMSIARKKRVIKDETRVRLSAASKGKNNYWYGKKLPAHVREASIRAIKNKKYSKSEGDKKSKALILSENKKRRPVCQLDMKTLEPIKYWRSASDAARSFDKRSASDIASAASNTNRKSAYGFKWRDLTTEELDTVKLETFYFDSERQDQSNQKRFESRTQT